MSLLIQQLGGKTSARRLIKNAPVGSWHIGLFTVADGAIEMYFDNQGYLFDQGNWVRAGQLRITDLQQNPQFKVFCSLTDIQAALQSPHARAQATWHADTFICDQLKTLERSNTKHYVVCALLAVLFVAAFIHTATGAIA